MSDWADRAAGKWYPKERGYTDETRAQLAKAIRSSAPDARLRKCLENIASCENDSVGREKMGVEYWYWKMIKDARAALSETKAVVCEWVYRQSDMRLISSCGHCDDTEPEYTVCPNCGRMQLCPNCGLPISVKEQTDGKGE